MADTTMVIANGFGIWGLGTPSLWGAHNWNAFLWGGGTIDMVTNVDKLISSDTAVSSIVKKNTDKYLAASTMVIDSSAAKNADKSISESLTLTEDMYSEGLQDGTMTWNYVFSKPSTEAENRSTATFVAGSNGSTSWSTASTSTTWS